MKAPIKFCVGMPTFDDFAGVYMTVQSLWLYHAHRLEEVVIIDNHPGTRTSQRLRDLAARAVRTRYIAYGDAVGTAAAKNRVFAEAAGEHVVCVDSHCMFAPGALDALADYYTANPRTTDLIQGPCLTDDHDVQYTHLTEEWGSDIKGKWGTSSPAELRQKSFPIRNMGMGMFSSLKSAWLGFHPGMRGFGGEEWVIHEKYRQAGRKTIMVTGAKWMHRFGDQTEAKPYPLRWFDRARNYWLAYTDLKLPVDELKTQFVDGGKITPDDWKAILDGKDQPCTTCNGVAVQHVTIEEWHVANAVKPSDVSEHLPAMAAMAAGNVVIDCGDRQGETVPAWLAGGAKQVWYVAPSKFGGSDAAHRLAPGRIGYVGGTSQTAPLEAFAGADILFIDTEPHNAAHVLGEMERLHGMVNKYIILHDTVSFGEKGQSPDGTVVPGVLAGIRAFVRAHPEWIVKRHDLNNHGLAVLSKLDDDKKPLPGLVRKALNFFGAVFDHAADGFDRLPDDQIELRRQACDMCEYRNDEQCSQCGCHLPVKATWRSADCPIARWPVPLTLPMVPAG